VVSEIAGIIFDDQEILGRGQKLLVKAGVLQEPDAPNCSKMQSDGSTRRFWRLSLGRQPCAVIVAPRAASLPELAEARAVWEIGRHLHHRQVAVPDLYGWDEESGVLCCEDLGDVRLHQVLSLSSRQELREWYLQALEGLVDMQLGGAVGFDTNWCWDTPRYDVALMRERESGYFLRAFWHGLLGRGAAPGIEEECASIASRAAHASSEFFLHRDFQSRNIMVHKGRLCFIDFQGGRFGPLAYDVASLLIDPYAGLSPSLQEELLAEYVRLVDARHPGAGAEVAASYPYLALQRNLQIIGAFAYLWKVRGKSFFSTYLRPALLSLEQRLSEPVFADFPVLRLMARQALIAVDTVVR
jgi:N-acetylmuramate 1-kinase